MESASQARDAQPSPRQSVAESTVNEDLFYYPLIFHICQPELLHALLPYLSFFDWCALFGLTSDSRKHMEGTRSIREAGLEKWLGTTGYQQWSYEPLREPLQLTLRVSS